MVYGSSLIGVTCPAMRTLAKPSSQPVQGKMLRGGNSLELRTRSGQSPALAARFVG